MQAVTIGTHSFVPDATSRQFRPDHIHGTVFERITRCKSIPWWYTAPVMPRSMTTHPDAVRFGRLLRDLRLQREWSLQQFARESHMTANYLGLLERGLNLPSLTAVINLAEVLGVDPGELVRHVAAGRRRSPPAVLPPLSEELQ